MKKIDSKSITGFPEFLPAEQIVFERVLNIIRKGYERYGFSPIETPSVERVGALTAKGGNEKEIYSLGRLAAKDGEDSSTGLALHFDLTIPLARYVVTHKNELTFPFRRYQIQRVWRGERPQSGRFREFYQCDIDVIGRGSLSLLTDAEMPSIIYKIFRDMEIGKFEIRINNRKVLAGFLKQFGLSDEQARGALGTIDDLEKIGVDKVSANLISKNGLNVDQVDSLVGFFEETKGQGTDEMLSTLKAKSYGEMFSQGVEELSSVVNNIRAFGVPDDYFKIDISLARGLEYYTGTVYETFLVDSQLSVCSGGRYDNLTEFFTEDKFPGVGISIGVTRLVNQLLKSGVLSARESTVAPVIVTTFEKSFMGEYLEIASEIRRAGINTETYMEEAKLGTQLKYASKKGFRIAIIAGGNEFDSGEVQIKDLGTGDAYTVKKNEVTSKIREILSDDLSLS